VTIDTALDFLKTANHPTQLIIGVVAILCLGGLLVWVETSRKDIKFWGIEITQPETWGQSVPCDSGCVPRQGARIGK
jgi:hypothetical protein